MKYEYEVLDIPIGSEDETTNYLDRMGEAGWELISVMKWQPAGARSDQRCYFKRPLQTPRKPRAKKPKRS